MYVSDLLEHVKYSEAKNLALIDDLIGTDTVKAMQARDQILSYINLGLTDLSTRFVVNTEVEILQVYPQINIYTVRHSKLIKVLEVYDSNGKSLRFPTVVNSTEYDIKELSYNTFLVPTPGIEQIAFVCKTTHPTVFADGDEVLLSESMLEPLINFVTAKALGAVGGNSKQDSIAYFGKYEASCLRLVHLGYNENPDVLSKNIRARGFV